jgi:hypothetical protein
MIAPIRVPDPWAPEQTRLLRKARRIVAAMLLGSDSPVPAEMPKLAGWKAWLFAGWTLAVAAAYVWSLVVGW